MSQNSKNLRNPCNLPQSGDVYFTLKYSLSLIKQLQQLYDTRHALAAVIGDRVVNPK